MMKSNRSKQTAQNATTPADNPISQGKGRKTQVKQTDVPRYTVQEALQVAQTLRDNFAKSPTKPMNVAMALELSPGSSGFRMLVGASAAYGLTEGAHNSEVISLTQLGRAIVAPTVDGEEQASTREALLKPRVIREFLTKYNGSRLPADNIAHNVLEEMGVPTDSSASTLKLILDAAKEVGLLSEHKGNFYVDIDGVAVSNAPEVDGDKDEATARLDSQPPASSSETERFQKSTSSAPESPNNNRVFVTHGKNLQIVNQLKELLTFGSFVPVVAAEHETVSKPVPDKVLDDMRSCYAAIIHVGKEVKLLDQDGNEHIFLNQNVLIEIGAAMALYGRRFIMLVEKGATLPSNLQGLYEVRYEGDRLEYDSTMKLLKAFNDFKS